MSDFDYRSQFFDPIYNAHGVTATLTPSSGSEVEVTIIDKTQGIDVGGGQGLVGTIRPACFIRVGELTDASLTRDDLADGVIAFNGNTWTIEQTKPRPSPKGELEGEYLLVLTEAES